MSTLDAAVARTRERHAAQEHLDQAVQNLRAAIAAAHADRWRIYEIMDATGLSRPTVARAIADARRGTTITAPRRGTRHTSRTSSDPRLP